MATGALALVFAAAVSAASPGPSLSVSSGRTLVVHGQGFRSSERVTLVLNAGRIWSRGAIADADGRFTATFPVTLSGCEDFSLQAFGSKGSRARVLPRPRTMCPAPTT